MVEHKIKLKIDSCVCNEPEEERKFYDIKSYIERSLGENLIGCGELKFNNFQTTMYMVVKNHTENAFIDSVRECLFNQDGFDLPIPKFLISITGGAKKFNVPADILQSFKSALIRVARNTSALIVSGGLDLGVMKVVGDAVKEDLYGGNQPVIGIASWRRSKLQHKGNAKDMKEVFLNELRLLRPEMEIENPTFFERQNENNLNPKHSCFIFVDNNHTDQFRGEMKFSAELQHAIVEKYNKIPLISIVLEGGIGTLETICHSIENRHPVLLIDKTGGCAALIKDLLKRKDEKDIINKLFNEGKYKDIFKERSNSSRRDKTENSRKFLESILKFHSEYINIFELTGKETEKNIEDEILKALTRIENGGDSKHKISLAITWDCFDKAKEELEKVLLKSDLNYLLKQALLEDKPDYITLLLNNNKISIKEFLTKSMLGQLYNNEFRNSKRPHHEPLNSYLQKHDIIKHDGEIMFENVEDFLKENFETLNVDSFLPGDHEDAAFEVKRPAINLFFWCILSNRIESAKIFWEIGSNQLCNALMASTILRFFSKKSYLSEDKNVFLDSAKKFEQLAIQVLTVFEENTRDFVNDVLVIRYLSFIRMDCLQLALKSDCKNFVAHRVVQNALENIWQGREEQNMEKLSKYEKSLLLCQKEYNETNQYIFGNNHLAAKKNELCWRFLNIPRTKFALHAISYIAFLVLFTVTMLRSDNSSSSSSFSSSSNNTKNSTLSLSNHQKTYLHHTLLAWIITWLIDEIRQLFFNNYPRYRHWTELKEYFSQGWNILDVLGCIAFIFGYAFLGCDLVSLSEFGHILLCVDLTTWYIRLLQVCLIMKKLGPKILMIREMLSGLAYFLIIIATFMLGFGVALQSLLNPYDAYMKKNSNKYSFIIFDILDKAYWPIYGEIPLLAVLNNNTCVKEDTCLTPLKYWSSYIFLMIYMIIASVLLINILIAMFTTIYQNIQENSDIIWKNQRYEFISNYVAYPFLPPPFSIIAYCFKCKHVIRHADPVQTDIEEEDDVIKEMERNCAKIVLKKTKNEGGNNEAKKEKNCKKLSLGQYQYDQCD